MYTFKTMGLPPLALNHLSCYFSSGHSPFREEGKTHEENIYILKVLYPKSPVFRSSENDTFPYLPAV